MSIGEKFLRFAFLCGMVLTVLSQAVFAKTIYVNAAHDLLLLMRKYDFIRKWVLNASVKPLPPNRAFSLKKQKTYQIAT